MADDFDHPVFSLEYRCYACGHRMKLGEMSFGSAGGKIVSGPHCVRCSSENTGEVGAQLAEQQVAETSDGVPPDG